MIDSVRNKNTMNYLWTSLTPICFIQLCLVGWCDSPAFTFADGSSNSVASLTRPSQPAESDNSPNDNPPNKRSVQPPPAELVESLQLDPFYEKWVSAHGIPILGSAQVSDYAILEAAFLVDRMLEHRPAIRESLIRNRLRVVVMAYNERTTSVPEHRKLSPPEYWDRRARGLGASKDCPVVSCAEENLLGYPGDPYAAENILIHEFGHGIHNPGLTTLDETFQPRLEKAYADAKKNGLWEGTYAITNHGEYWAEAVQSYFDTNRRNDELHNHVDTREKLQEYDLPLFSLCEEVFGKDAWRYSKPDKRTQPAEIHHLKGYDASVAPMFKWESQKK